MLVVSDNRWFTEDCADCLKQESKREDKMQFSAHNSAE